MNAKTIIRKAKDKENPYAQIARSAAQDPQLSWKATGLLIYILSLPDTWRLHLSDLAKRKLDGISATKAALKELALAGYVEKISTRDEKGRFIKHEHIVHEQPIENVLTTIQKSNSGFVDTINIQDSNNTASGEKIELEYDWLKQEHQAEQSAIMTALLDPTLTTEQRDQLRKNKTLVHVISTNPDPDAPIFRKALI